MIGKRLGIDETGKLVIDYSQTSGNYGYGKFGQDIEAHWWAHVPAVGFGWGRLCDHSIVEHEDGTITASPSILVSGAHGKQWHGYLERGVWREC